jgi:hypothetical protein
MEKGETLSDEFSARYMYIPHMWILTFVLEACLFFMSLATEEIVLLFPVELLSFLVFTLLVTYLTTFSMAVIK